MACIYTGRPEPERQTTSEEGRGTCVGLYQADTCAHTQHPNSDCVYDLCFYQDVIRLWLFERIKVEILDLYDSIIFTAVFSRAGPQNCFGSLLIRCILGCKLESRPPHWLETVSDNNIIFVSVTYNIWVCSQKLSLQMICTRRLTFWLNKILLHS